MYGERMLNIWAIEQRDDYFHPLGKIKIAKLIDFLSTHKVCVMLREKRIAPDEDLMDRCEKYKKGFEESLLYTFANNPWHACKVYTYYKKIIDSRESFSWDYFIANEETPLPISRPLMKKPRVPRKPKEKKAQQKKKPVKKPLPENVIRFSDYANRKIS